MKADCKDHSHKTWVQWVVQGGKPDRSAEISQEVRRSWTRCLEEYGLDPDGQREAEALTRKELRERQERLGEFLEISKVEMNNLFQQVAPTGYSIILADADGVILHQVSDSEVTQTVSERGLSTGTVWSEEAEGTNGIGTSLVEKKPVVIHRGDHFLSRNTDLTCSGAPIFDPDGELMAVLDISGCSRLAQQHSQVLVQMASQMIENRAFLGAFRDRFMIRFHSRPEFVSTLGEGVLVFDDNGRCVAANRSGLFQLGHESRDGLIGREIQEIFHSSLDDLMDRARHAFLQALPLHEAVHNRRFFAMVQPPESFSRGGGMAKGSSGKTRIPATTPEDPGEPSDSPELGDPQMARNVALLRKAADRNIPILLLGETGTGKGVLAEAFHRFSRRADKPLVSVCCSAIPETLIESELFGYQPGAFTGASREGRQGKVRQADGGTLFLDEIGDMPLSLQPRLLRLLEEREVVPLGSEKPVSVDLQVVSATNCNLEELVGQGQFREDLYYRLKGLEIPLIPLRERCDKHRLIQHLVARENPDGEPVELDDELLELLKSHPWPGNIRQLRNVLRGMLALRDDDRLTVADLPPGFRQELPDGPSMSESTRPNDGQGILEQAEGEALFRVLDENHWNISATAQKLGFSRNTLYRKMRQLGIQRPGDR